MRKTPTKVVEKGNDNNLLSSVKKAAVILVAALGLNVATSQDVNAQLFKGRDLKNQIEQNNDQLAQNKKVKAHNNETIAGNNKDIAEIKEDIKNQEKIIAGLRADLGKDSKNPLKSNRSSFAYNSTKPKDNSKIVRDPNN